MKKVTTIMLSCAALAGLVGMIVAIILGHGFTAWAGISLGITILALLPLAIFFLMYLGTSDDKVIKPSEKDKEDKPQE
jgi:membrane protein implicated in regulation of membrane protease activity